MSAEAERAVDPAQRARHLERREGLVDEDRHVLARRRLAAGTDMLDELRIALGIEDGHVEVWETRGFTLAAKKLLHNGRVVNVDISEDGTRVVSVGKDTKVRVTELADDPVHLVNAYAYPKLLQEVSENPIALADSATFVAPNQVVVTTRGGALAEVLVKGTPAPIPTPKPRKPLAVDTDY